MYSQLCINLRSFTIPNSITSINSGAFSSCLSLTSITIPDSVTEIGGWVLAGCLNLSEIKSRFATDDGRCLIVNGVLNSFAPAGLTEYNIPESVTSIGDIVFVNCSSLTNITIPESVSSIGDSAFANCSSLTNVILPDNIISIDKSVFYGCESLRNINIPKSVVEIGASAFYGCKGTLTIDSKIIETDYDYNNYPSFSFSIYSGWLYGSNFSSIVIGENITKLGKNVFRDCVSLVSIDLTDSITAIEGGAFYGCSSLESITIPESVSSIGEAAFYGCSSLASVYCKPTTPPSGNYNMFYDNASGRKIYVPTESVEAYKAAEGWSDYADCIEGYDFE